jgi:hypothetical protein
MKRFERMHVYFLLFICFFFSIDATANGRLGRFVNDAVPKKANCVAKPVYIADQPHVLLFANADIPDGKEICFDYGVVDAPWRKVRYYFIFYPQYI